MAKVRMGYAADLDAVQPLWLTLHQHDRNICEVPLQSDDTVSWQVRRTHYTELMRDGTGMLFIADEEDHPVGYAFAISNPGPDDTWGFKRGWAEIYSLSVAPEHRDAGIGTLLVEAVATEAKARGLDGLEVATMTTNADAIRFYEERGFAPAEVVLLRFDL